MPYILPENRKELETRAPDSSGELNYVITGIIWDYYCSNGRRYPAINDILGALEGAKLEFYRRIAAPYEDNKMRENGDVY